MTTSRRPHTRLRRVRLAAPLFMLVALVAGSLLQAESTGGPEPNANKNMDRPTFVHDVAPVLHENCAHCHQPGEIAPMALRSYDEVRPWAKSIAKAVKNRDMPPWDADPGYGPWANDISLSDEEVDMIVRWVDQGAPRGEGAEPTPVVARRENGWQLGEPDWVFEFDPMEIPADGPDQFKIVPMDTGWKEDKWISGVEVLAGDPEVVHHFILWRANEDNSNQDAWLAGWAAGAGPTQTPTGTARLLPAGRNLLGDFHYHPKGEATVDKTRIGIHFADANEIKKEFTNLWVLNANFKIPAGDPNYEARASYVFPQDVELMSLTPHMHYRGKDMRYIAHFPDGTKKDLLSVSQYDFNWQTNYDFVDPIKAPAGTEIEVIAHWDNSAENAANPDPTKDIGWGTESTDEMLIGFVDYVVKDGVSAKPISLVLGKLAELSRAYPGQVWRIDLDRGNGEEPTAVHLPKDGSQGGWYVQMGSLVLPAPIKDVVWDGNSITATAHIPGQEPTPVSATVDPESGEIDLEMMGGTMRGAPAEAEAERTVQAQPVGD